MASLHPAVQFLSWLAYVETCEAQRVSILLGEYVYCPGHGARATATAMTRQPRTKHTLLMVQACVGQRRRKVGIQRPQSKALLWFRVRGSWR